MSNGLSVSEWKKAVRGRLGRAWACLAEAVVAFQDVGVGWLD